MFEKDLIYWTIAIVQLLVRAFSNHALVDKMEFMNNIEWRIFFFSIR